MTGAGGPAIDAVDLVREYRMGDATVRALDGLTLRLDAGQFVSVVGPSGAGKSTLLHVMGALDVPDSGRILVDGSDISAMDDDELSTFRRRRVGFVFQFFNLVPTLSAWENVALPRLLDGTPLRRSRTDAQELLDRVGLGNRADHRPGELSGGQMQRVAIARSLIMGPRILLADEPTGNLDSQTGAAILDLLGDVARDGEGRLVVMVTHDVNAAEVADRTVTVRDGRIAS
ncbi:ABC transporter ATP-binding protein [Williamsia deligens]|nr:putative ABC transport system ATP-binding protein [Williamsia deligens]